MTVHRFVPSILAKLLFVLCFTEMMRYWHGLVDVYMLKFTELKSDDKGKNSKAKLRKW